MKSELSLERKALALDLLDYFAPPSEEEIIAAIFYLIEEYGCRFKVTGDLMIVPLAEDRSEEFLRNSVIRFTSKSYSSININLLLFNINIYIITRGSLPSWPMSKANNSLATKYLNLLNLNGELSYLDLSGYMISANQSMLNKIKYLDKMNKLGSKLSNRKNSSAPHIEISIPKSNKNNISQETLQDAETARLQNKDSSEANTEANASSKLTIMLTSPDSKESIKEALKEERKKRNLRSKKVVEHLKKRVEEYNEKMELISYFPSDWFTRNLTSVYRMRKIIDPDFIVRAIDWFFDNKWWAGKITDIYQVEKHYNKFAAAQKGKSNGVGLIAQRLKELEEERRSK